MNFVKWKISIFFIVFFATLILWFTLFPGSSQSASEEKPSSDLIARGRKLFNNTDGLGTKYACILCHQKGKEIKNSEVAKAGDQLPAVINKYLVDKAKGKALDKNSEEMKALAAYITYEHSK